MRFWFITFLVIPLFLSAQMYDDFSDGDFTADPPWYGDVDDFIVNSSFQLQLNAATAGISHLSTHYEMNGETEWQFWIKMNFAPSDNNMARVYLASDKQSLNGPLNGYFLRFGENLSNDAIELYRQNGETLTLICRGTDGLIANAFQLWLRIRRDVYGNWTIEKDNTGYGVYQQEATGFDDQILTSSFLGVYCKYTVSNIKNFCFDQFYAGPHIIDNEPPQLVNIDATSANNLDIYFNEALLPAQAINTQNYFVSHSIENPMIAQLDTQNPGKVMLLFDRSFPNGMPLTITIKNIADLNGNTAPTIESEFMWFRASAFDVQINEIMADPDPPVGLPNVEFIEILNTTDKEINISGWRLIIGNTIKVFSQLNLQPNQYLLVGHENSAQELSQYALFYGFSGFQLPNSGQTITLKNMLDQVISTVTYSDEWYDTNKKDGGWSLEQIDPENPCGGKNNWTASISSTGGTPGAPNSVKANNPDILAPQTARVEYISTTEIVLHFSEPMDSLLLNVPQSYHISPSIGYPTQAIVKEPDYSRVAIILNPENPLKEDVVYALEVLNDLFDCAGNLIDKSKITYFGIPRPVNPNDIVINEILFNPREDIVKGVDFVEILNISDKILDLSTLVLATEDKSTGEISTPKNISKNGLLLFPENYMTLTTNPDVVKQQYYTENPDNFTKMESLPQYSNADGIVILATKGHEVIDRVEYSENMHIPLLKSYKGVSLERINPLRPSNDITNWHSAAEDFGFATPGYKNSQYSDVTFIDDPITIQPDIFSPDMDGKDDVLNINYMFESPGFIASITIFDTRGRLIRKLIQNELLGTEGTFSWNGITDHGQKAAIGIYIILFEAFDLNGNKRNYKKTAVLGGYL
ncbi:MAG TPA: lamin tail domain-containing protein [Bacteroidales bacterium]|nr:MAG: hypothetical protein BWX63_00367 [Bacteroidetes bacterium ADurb.Bin041]HPW42403.1 lamin tail domain-containing protein [Bacteroidales bacterium]